MVDYNAFLKNLSISSDMNSKYPQSGSGKDFPNMSLRILNFLLSPKEILPSMGKNASTTEMPMILLFKRIM